MTKNKKIVGIILLVALFIFNIIFFALPAKKDANFWISYIFGILALIGQLGVWLLAWDKAHDIKSKFMGVPIIYVSYRFLILQIVSSFIFLGLGMSIYIIPFYIPLIINSIILGICIISISVIDISRDEINRVEEKITTKVSYIKSLQTELEIILEREEDEFLREIILGLIEKIRYSDPISSEKLESLEIKILEKVSLLESDIKKESIEELSNLVDERNKKSKLLK